jgi:hypothetical protein
MGGARDTGLKSAMGAQGVYPALARGRALEACGRINAAA